MILIAIGANLPDRHGAHPLATCRAAAEALRALPGLRFARLSRWYETAPIPPSGQPPFVNGVARLEGNAGDPAALLARLHTIEVAAGRVRSVANAARVLDLDIIDIDGLLRDAPDPVLPHPRAHERAFVLRPLADVAPGWIHPRLGLGVAALLAALPPQDVRPL
jgi:2-amino-4-hydroxy-6-hydroxymethyldihydropteridine diphosphokinase